MTELKTMATSDRRRRRLGGLAGIGWFALFGVGALGIQSEPQAWDAPVAETRAYFAANGGSYLVGDYLAALGFILFFLPFVAILRHVLTGRDGSASATLIVAGGVATVAVGGVTTSFLDGVALARGAISDDVVALLQYDNAAGIALLGLPAALFAAATAVAIAVSGALPRWLVPLGGVTAVLLTVGAAFVLESTSDGVLFTVRFISFIALALFILAISICLLLGVQGRSESYRRIGDGDPNRSDLAETSSGPQH